MAILRVRDEQGNVYPIPAIKGEKGERGFPGTGILFGSYVGDGSSTKTITFDCAVSAVLILTQSFESGVPNNAFLIRGGFLTDELRDEWYQLARLGRPAANASYLEVKNATYNVHAETEYQNGFNINGTTYHYIAFVSEEG